MGSWSNGRSRGGGPRWGWSGSLGFVSAFSILTLPTPLQLSTTMDRSFQRRKWRADLIKKLVWLIVNALAQQELFGISLPLCRRVMLCMREVTGVLLSSRLALPCRSLRISLEGKQAVFPDSTWVVAWFPSGRVPGPFLKTSEGCPVYSVHSSLTRNSTAPLQHASVQTRQCWLTGLCFILHSSCPSSFTNLPASCWCF